MNDASDVIKGGLELRKDSKWWYGRFQIDGTRKVKNLRVEMRGTPPGPNDEHGSAQYERSRAQAEAALKTLLAEMNSRKTAEELAQAVHEVRTGRRVYTYHLTDLPRLWDEIPRNKPVSKEHQKKSLGRINDFSDWMAEQFPRIKLLDHLNEEHARAYMDFQKKRGITPRTWNFVLSTLKTACRRGNCPAFNDIKQKPLDTVHRIPFSPEELQAVLTAAKTDELIYPLVVTAACTAMRKGDCCRLRWASVDLESGFITVKTSKTGRSVDIPLADLLREEIEKQTGNGSKYVFPRLAERYTTDDTYLTKRFKRILASAGFHDGKTPSSLLAPYDSEELATKAHNYFSRIRNDQKRRKVRAVFEHYTEGHKLSIAAERAGVSKSTASLYLNTIEQETGIAFIRKKPRKAEALPPCRGDVCIERETGIRRASVRDFHALRTTWITLALMSGLPMELVQTITGHATAEIVMEHYFKPQREQLKTAMQSCLPGLLTCATSPTAPTRHEADANSARQLEKALQLLDGFQTPKNRKQIKEIAELISDAKATLERSI